jgi:HTH-type transcriptional regulator, competence development regulator
MHRPQWPDSLNSLSGDPGTVQCAQRVGISPAYLSKVERGEFASPSEQRIRVLAKLLNDDAEKLLHLAGRIPLKVSNLLRRDKALFDIVCALQRMSPTQRKEFREFVRDRTLVPE